MAQVQTAATFHFKRMEPHMTSFIASHAPSAVSTTRVSTASERAQALARWTGFFFLVTYAASIPPVLHHYVPALSDPAFVLGGGYDRSLAWGTVLEIVLILANLGTALALWPVLRHASQALALGYVGARLTENTFIAFGIIALLALNTLRMQGGDPAALTVAGQALVALHDWTFRIGPGVIVGFGNGLILGWLMWKTRLVPRYLSILGLIGGPAILLSGAAVMLGLIEAASPSQIIATIPEFFWELSLGLWLLIRGFAPDALRRLGIDRD